MRQMMERGPQGFGPWQMCCRAMTDLVQAPHADTASAARVFNALADGTRLKIIKRLSKREHNVDELVQLLGVAQSTASHHLRVLKEAGGENVHVHEIERSWGLEDIPLSDFNPDPFLERDPNP